MDLKELGWNLFFEEDFRTFAKACLEAARVAVVGLTSGEKQKALR
jgi:hypothetical protein